MKRFLLYLLCCLAINQLALSQPSSQERINSGKQNIKAKNYKAAVSDFEQVLNENNTDTAALSGIIKAYLLSEDLKNAEIYVNKAVSSYPQNAEYIFRNGILNNLKGELDLALEEFDKSINLNPNSSLLVQIYLNRASSYMRLENYEKALGDYNSAIELSPRNPNIYNLRGFASYKTGKYSESIIDFTKALDLDPKNASAFYNRGMAHLKINEKPKACFDFHKACNLGYINACKMIMAECAQKK